MIRYRCIQCGAEMQSPNSLAGATDYCPDCGAANAVPSHPGPQGGDPPVQRTAAAPVTVTCPKCNSSLQLLEAAPGAKMRCGACREPFVLQAGPDGKLRAEPLAVELKAAAPAPAPHRRRQASAPAAGHAPAQAAAPPAAAATAAAHGQAKVAVDIGNIVQSLWRAISLKKLGFYLIFTIATLVVCGGLMLLSAWLALRNPEAGAFLTVLVAIIAIGMFGVISGGVARMAHTENQGQGERFNDAVMFSLRNFHSLFGGMLLLVLALLLIAGMVNGLAFLLQGQRSYGSFMASFLFLPQVLVNLLVVLGVLVAVLLPCALAVEGIGAFKGLARFLLCLIRKPRQLLLQVIVAGVFGAITLLVLSYLVAAALGISFLANGPEGGIAGLFDSPSHSSSYGFSSGGGFGGGFGSRYASRGSAGSSPPKGDWLRYASAMLVMLPVLIYPAVFWIIAFTGFYEEAQPSLAIGKQKS